jgi:hypothetical protein
MGKQYNKVLKRRRREKYIKRKHQADKTKDKKAPAETPAA